MIMLAQSTAKRLRPVAYSVALKRAKQYARSGPRVAAVLKTKSGRYVAAPGFVDEDTDTVKQVALVTPDGRIWVIL